MGTVSSRRYYSALAECGQLITDPNVWWRSDVVSDLWCPRWDTVAWYLFVMYEFFSQFESWRLTAQSVGTQVCHQALALILWSVPCGVLRPIINVTAVLNISYAPHPFRLSNPSAAHNINYVALQIIILLVRSIYVIINHISPLEFRTYWKR